jgi:hypothetical protein
MVLWRRERTERSWRQRTLRICNLSIQGALISFLLGACHWAEMQITNPASFLASWQEMKKQSLHSTKSLAHFYLTFPDSA